MRVDLETKLDQMTAAETHDLLAELDEALDRIASTRLVLLAARELGRPAIATPRWFPR